jgi:hypothetical protein
MVSGHETQHINYLMLFNVIVSTNLECFSVHLANDAVYRVRSASSSRSKTERAFFTSPVAAMAR